MVLQEIRVAAEPARMMAQQTLRMRTGKAAAMNTAIAADYMVAQGAAAKLLPTHVPGSERIRIMVNGAEVRRAMVTSDARQRACSSEARVMSAVKGSAEMRSADSAMGAKSAMPADAAIVPAETAIVAAKSTIAS